MVNMEVGLRFSCNHNDGKRVLSRSGPGAVAHTRTPSAEEAEAGGSPELRSSRPACASVRHPRTPNPLPKTNDTRHGEDARNSGPVPARGTRKA